MKIDTEIHYVTKPGANLCLALGFPTEEAQRLHLASKKQINDTKQLKEQLMTQPKEPHVRRYKLQNISV